METIIGIKALKDKWREAKIRAGDMRGFSHTGRFELAERFGLNKRQVAFDSIAPKEGKIEIEASMYIYNDVINTIKDYGSVYTLEDLVETLEGESEMEIQFIKVQWNKQGTDANRNNIMEAFLYKPHS